MDRFNIQISGNSFEEHYVGSLSALTKNVQFFSESMCGEQGGKVVEHQTLNGEVLGSIPMGGTLLCPRAEHINSLQYWFNPGSVCYVPT